VGIREVSPGGGVAGGCLFGGVGHTLEKFLKNFNFLKKGGMYNFF